MDYQGNSKKNKKDDNTEPKKNLEPIVTGEVISKPKPVGSKFKAIFFGGDFRSATEFVLAEVLLPAVRNVIVESVSKGADRLIYGESMHRQVRRPPNYTSRIQYNNPVLRGDPINRALLPNQSARTAWVSNRKDFDDIILTQESEANAVVERLIDIVDQYEVVSIADLSEILGQPSSPIDNKWGWTNLATIEVRQVREGWRISFPPLEEIS